MSLSSSRGRGLRSVMVVGLRRGASRNETDGRRKSGLVGEQTGSKQAVCEDTRIRRGLDLETAVEKAPALCQLSPSIQTARDPCLCDGSESPLSAESQCLLMEKIAEVLCSATALSTYTADAIVAPGAVHSKLVLYFPLHLREENSPRADTGVMIWGQLRMRPIFRFQCTLAEPKGC